MNPILRHIRCVTAGESLGGLTDDELLDRYVGHGDQAGFETLLRRHGPMVLGVCRRILADTHAADDAFQATFLVLARRARAICKRGSVASWLHGVARRVAIRARESGRVRRWYERRWRHPQPLDALREVVWSDVGAILDEEIRRLPERIRAPFVLCYLEGETNDAAARVLGCPTGTVLSRLSKARELLRTRLTRRGLVLSAGLLAATPAEAIAAVPATLVRATAGLVLSPAGRPTVLALADADLRARPGAVVLALAAVGLVCAAAVPILGRDPAPEPPDPPAPPAAVAEKPASDLDRLQGTWVVTASVVNGFEEPAARIRGNKATFSGNTVTFTGPNAPSQTCTLTIDPSASPKVFDSEARDGPTKGRTSRGIYRFDGDTLQICYTLVCVGPPNIPLPPQPGRPDEFKAPLGSFRQVLTFRRAPPAP